MCIENRAHVCKLIVLFTHYVCLHLFAYVVFTFALATWPQTCGYFFIQFHFNAFVSFFSLSHPFKTDQHLLQWHIRCVQIPWRRNKMLRIFSSRLQWARILLCLQSTLYRRRRFRVNFLMPNSVYRLWFPSFPIAYIFFGPLWLGNATFVLLPLFIISSHTITRHENREFHDLFETDKKWALFFTPKRESKIFVHSHFETFGWDFRPHIIWEPDFATELLISMKQTYTTDDARQLSIAQRKCIFSDEIKLDIYEEEYTFTSCMKVLWM